MPKEEIYRIAGLGNRVGYGQRPAIIVIDLQNGFTDVESPLAGNMDDTIAAVNKLVVAARPKGIPAIFTIVGYERHLLDAGLWLKKAPTLSWVTLDSKWVDIDPRLNREADDPLIVKKFASSFFGTHLDSLLRQMGIDTVIMTGCTTSGCVRATCVDALQYGYRCIVPKEAVGDRAEEPQAAALFDINAKYGDVVSLQEVLEYIEQLKKEE